MPPEYRPIEGFPGYRVGDDGSVWSSFFRNGEQWRPGGEWRRLKPRCNRTGYPRASLNRDGETRLALVHVLVLEAFVGPRPDGMQACHLDDDKANPALANLRWDTPRANWEDRRRNDRIGWRPRGTDNHQAKLTDESALALRIDRVCGMSYKSLSQKYGLTMRTVYQAANNETWKHVPMPELRDGHLVFNPASAS